ncbi:MAG: 8-amino-7-oxononanoate synthase [Methylovulum sp.]|jgi:8-amino-7-oxononanoate synthase|nr:8-amino-7-oxononanoate synthase [Methylovulum sp.]
MAFTQLSAQLVDLIAQDLYRTRQIIDSTPGVHVQIAGRQLINFSSNDYLGLANHPQVKQAFKEAVDAFGVGSGAAHLVCGHHRVHHDLENDLAEFTGRERALLFSTGFMANLGIMDALLTRQDRVFEDRLNHASLIDGGLASGARFKRYRHADMADLQRHLLAKTTALNTLVVSDGVFSMDGDGAPLAHLVALATHHQAWLMIDDAHGFGVLGEQGGGIVAQHGFTQQEVPILMATFGKALGTFGAFVAGSETLIDTIIQRARSYIYTTALPPAIAVATRVSLQLMIKDTWRRQKLQTLIAHFREGAEHLGVCLMPSSSAIQPIMVGTNQRALALSAALREQGFWVSAIRPPTVPTHTARLRVTFSALHELAEVDALLAALEKCLINS